MGQFFFQQTVQRRIFCFFVSLDSAFSCMGTNEISKESSHWENRSQLGWTELKNLKFQLEVQVYYYHGFLSDFASI